MKRSIAWLLGIVMLIGCTVCAAAEEAAGTEVDIGPGLVGVMEEPEAENTEINMPVPEDVPFEGRLTGVKIGIDPGHQAHGNNEQEAIAPGSRQTKAKVSSGTEGVRTHIAEYVTVLEIAFKLRQALESEGAEVYMTRESHDVDISNQERAIMMNEIGVDLVLRIHCDGSDNHSTTGIGLYVTATGPIAEESYKAATCLMPRLCEATGAREFGIYRFDTYTGQNWSTVPCIMVECGFMSNPEEDVKLNDPAYQQLLAEGMVEGICDYMEL